MSIQYWPISPELEREVAENYRTRFALGLADKSVLDIIRQLTFDGAAPRITPAYISDLFDVLERKFLKKRFAGVGVEVGAGPLVFSSILAQRSDVSRMYGVEICKPIIEVLYPKVAEVLLKARADKTIGVVGNFDAMQLPDASVDFVFDFFSLHHSHDICMTLQEIRRILKPGGFLLMLDKARPDTYTDTDLAALLDQTYAESYNRQFGLPAGSRLTRRENGEREYRLKDWRAAMDAAGFSRMAHYHIERTVGGSMPWRMVKRGLAALPIALQSRIVTRIPWRMSRHRFELSHEHSVFLPATNPFRKGMSLMIAWA